MSDVVSEFVLKTPWVACSKGRGCDLHDGHRDECVRFVPVCTCMFYQAGPGVWRSENACAVHGMKGRR